VYTLVTDSDDLCLGQNFIYYLECSISSAKCTSEYSTTLTYWMSSIWWIYFSSATAAISFYS